MFIRMPFALALLAPMLCTAPLSAQQKMPSAPTAASSISLDVVVTPKSGLPVADLQQQDFTILDNKTPRHITSFHALGGSQAPIQVILVIDAVNLPYERIAYERGEIDKFLHANGGRLAYPTALAFFTDKGIQAQQGSFTDGNELSASMDSYAVGLRDIRRSSQWEARDRFQLSVTALRELVGSVADRPQRKIILWVSPGWPLLSGPGVYLDPKQQGQLFSTIAELSTQLRQANVTLYSINPIGAAESIGRTFYYQDFLKGVSKPGQVQVGDLSLQVLATQSGGLVLNGSNSTATLLEQCMADTEAYYVLSFDPPPTADHPNEYHHIEVQVARPGLTARTRDGYYLQP
jgi:VWFA-related protein